MKGGGGQRMFSFRRMHAHMRDAREKTNCGSVRPRAREKMGAMAPWAPLFLCLWLHAPTIRMSHTHSHYDSDVIPSPAGNWLRGGQSVSLTHVGLSVVETVGVT